MNTFNTITSAIFDILLRPFGIDMPTVSILLWSILGAIVALQVYKHTSHQKGIARAKNQIKVHLLEIRLFGEDIRRVFIATWQVLGQNLLYLTHNIVPMFILFIPMMAILVQLEAQFAFAPMTQNSVVLLKVKLDPTHSTLAPTDVALELPDGIALDAPPVRAATGEIAWRLRTVAAGNHVLKLHVDGQTIEKGVAVAGAPRKVPVLRTKTLEAFLYPGEAALPGDSPLVRIAIEYPKRNFAWLPSGEVGILLSFFALSLAAGFTLKGLFGVTL